MEKSINFTAKILTWLSFGFIGYLTFYSVIESSKKIDTELIFPLIFIGMVLGGFILFIIQSIHKSYINSIDRMVIENHFKAIVQNSQSISFSKRIDDLTFFSYKEYSLVFNIKKNDFFVFLNEDCILNSITISGSKTILELRELIWSKFTTQINDCVTLNNIIYSKNLVNQESINNYFNIELEKAREFFLRRQESSIVKEIKVVKELDIDEILDKINKFGIKSLTTEEIDFLKKQSQ